MSRRLGYRSSPREEPAPLRTSTPVHSYFPSVVALKYWQHANFIGSVCHSFWHLSSDGQTHDGEAKSCPIWEVCSFWWSVRLQFPRCLELHSLFLKFLKFLIFCYFSVKKIPKRREWIYCWNLKVLFSETSESGISRFIGY